MVLFLRVELMCGKLSPSDYRQAIDATRQDLTAKAAADPGPDNFLLDFLNRWKTETGVD